MPFLFFTIKGGNPDSLFVHFCTFLYFLSDFSQSSGLIVVVQIMLEVSNNLSASTDIYTLKGFYRVF